MSTLKSTFQNTARYIKNLSQEPIYPILIAVYPILFLYNHNIGELTRDVLFYPLLLTIVASILIFFVFKFLYKSWAKAAVAAGVSLAIFFVYGSFSNPLPDEFARIGDFVIGPDKVVFPITLLLLGVFYWKWYKSRFTGVRAIIYLNAFSVVLVATTLFQIVQTELTKSSASQDVAHASTVQLQQDVEKLSRVVDKPDVYYLVFDRYAANNVLQDSYNYDNSKFYDWLRSEGFFVAENTLSNYLKTSFSLSGTLNLNYHDASSWKDKAPTEATDIYPLFRNNLTQRVFHKMGYKNYSLASWFWATAQEPGTDKVYQYQTLYWLRDPYVRELLSMTMLMPVMEQVFRDNTADSVVAHQVYTDYQLKSYSDVINAPGPKFVMSHILLPHGPYLFDRECVVNPVAFSGKSSDEKYIEQLQCATKTAREMVAAIKQQSGGEAIIVIQADEGASSQKSGKENQDNNWVTSSDSALHERANVLNAFYFPDKNYSLLSDDISSVNTFRVIFSQYFDQNYELLPNKTYAFGGDKDLFNLTEVTERLK